MLSGADIVTCVPSPGQAGAALLSLPGSGSDVRGEVGNGRCLGDEGGGEGGANRKVS